MPDNKEELIRKKKELLALYEKQLSQMQPGEDVSFGDAAFEGMAQKVGNSLLAPFRLAGDTLAFASAGAETLADLAVPGDPVTFSDKFQREQNRFPASLLRAVPAPTLNEFTGALQALPSLAGGPGAFNERRKELTAQFDDELAQRRESAPFGFGVGDIAGDALLMTTGRLPFASRIAAFERSLMNPRAVEAIKPNASIIDEITKIGERVLASPKSRKVARGLFRAGESSLEAAMIDIINEDNPLETAAYAAAYQMAGSGVLEVASDAFRGGSVSGALGNAALLAAGAGMFLMLAEQTDNPVEAFADGVTKVQAVMIGGLLAAGLGASRMRGAETAPRIIDSLSSLSRNSILSIIEDWADAEEETKQKVGGIIDTVMSNPDSIPMERLNEIVRAIKDGRIVEDIDDLSFPDAPPKLDAAPLSRLPTTPRL